MKVQKFRKINLLAAILVIVLVLASVRLQSALVAFLALGVYLGLISLLKIRVEGVLADERQIMAGEKAARASFQILLPILALASTAMLASSGKQEFYYLRGLGIVLGYVTCLGLVIYLLAY